MSIRRKKLTPRECMELAVELADKCRDEDARPHPKVGVVIVDEEGREISSAYRCETGDGDHAEYAALDKKDPNKKFSGSTVYTTLEPCTKRNPPKIPCVRRLIDRKVKRVVFGIMDPNPTVHGKGYQALRRAGIETAFFEPDLQSRIEEMNRDFLRLHEIEAEGAGKRIGKRGKAKKAAKNNPINTRNIKNFLRYDLDEAYQQTNSIFWENNLRRGQTDMFCHLVEVFRGLSQLVSDKTTRDVSDEARSIPKVLAWWMTLCGKMGVKSISRMLWTKFPYVCPYCYSCPHKHNECIANKKKHDGPDWELLVKKAKSNLKKRPTTLGGWQRMYAEIYPGSQTDTSFDRTFARLIEELSELAEAVKVGDKQPGYFLSEAADLFAWLMRIQNLLDDKNGAIKETRGQALEIAFFSSYPGICRDCGNSVCKCPLILQRTIGRIATEVPAFARGTGKATNFLTKDQANDFFQPRKGRKSTQKDVGR